MMDELTSQQRHPCTPDSAPRLNTSTLYSEDGVGGGQSRGVKPPSRSMFSMDFSVGGGQSRDQPAVLQHIMILVLM